MEPESFFDYRRKTSRLVDAVHAVAAGRLRPAVPQLRPQSSVVG